MDLKSRNHIDNLGRHGATVLTAGGERKLNGAFYDEIVRFCEKYRINCIGYEIRIPETDEKLMIAIWRNGHADSGSEKHIREIMNQY